MNRSTAILLSIILALSVYANVSQYVARKNVETKMLYIVGLMEKKILVQEEIIEKQDKIINISLEMLMENGLMEQFNKTKIVY